MKNLDISKLTCQKVLIVLSEKGCCKSDNIRALHNSPQYLLHNQDPNGHQIAAVLLKLRLLPGIKIICHHQVLLLLCMRKKTNCFTFVNTRNFNIQGGNLHEENLRIEVPLVHCQESV